MIRILKYAELTPAEVFSRSEPTASVSDIVTDIINDVIADGDEALVRYAAKFDGIDPEGFALELSDEERAAALASIEETDPGFTGILAKSAAYRKMFGRQPSKMFEHMPLS